MSDGLVNLLADHGDVLAERDRLQAENRQLQSEFAIVSRACGNWREWPEEMITKSKDAPDWVHADWQVAARAVIERNEIQAENRRLNEALILAQRLILQNDANAALDEINAALAPSEARAVIQGGTGEGHGTTNLQK